MLQNKAAELGPSRFPWWPDWRGECVAIVASGPSAKSAGVEKLRNRIHVIAINESWQLAPWADIFYGCDAPFWRHRRGLPDLPGLKLTWEGDNAHRPPDFPGLYKIAIETKVDRILLDQPGRVGAGGNSGFQANNLSVQFGATGIMWIGFDMRVDKGVHWYGRNNWNGANNPEQSNLGRWRMALDGAAPHLKALGVDVVNCSPVSALTAYPKMTIDDALARWGL